MQVLQDFDRRHGAEGQYSTQRVCRRGVVMPAVSCTPARPGPADGRMAPAVRGGFRLALGAVLAVALILRLAGLGVTHDWPIRADPVDYVRHAVSIAHGHGYPPTNVGPGGGPTAL